MGTEESKTGSFACILKCIDPMNKEKLQMTKIIKNEDFWLTDHLEMIFKN